MRGLEIRPAGAGSAGLVLESAEVSFAGGPAASLTARFLCQRPPGLLEEVQAWQGDAMIFRGKPDRQQASLTGEGLLCRVEARSAGALLLDNEALPTAYANVDLDTIFTRHAAPYGFSLEHPGPARRLALYTVPKGASEWDALREFCLRAHGEAPWVRGSVIRLGEPASGRLLTVSNRGGNGVPFTSLALERIPYHIISQVVLRDELGRYSSGVDNPAALALGIRRKRYEIPSTEFADHGAAFADRRISRSMADSLRAVVTIPALVEAEANMAVKLAEPGFEEYGLAVKEWTLRTGPGGEETRLVLGGR